LASVRLAEHVGIFDEILNAGIGGGQHDDGIAQGIEPRVRAENVEQHRAEADHGRGRFDLAGPRRGDHAALLDGSLGTKEAQQIVPRVVEKMKEYDPWNIYLTRDTHYENYLDTQEGRNLPVEHCIEGTHGWQLNDAVAKAAEKATVIDKPTFGSNRLAGILMTERAQEALEIELVGLCTDICVVSNALLFKAAMPEAPITVDASCCAGVTPESHRHALETMKMCQIKVVND
jgi:nicotinamidase/pyrazinamidase